MRRITALSLVRALMVTDRTEGQILTYDCYMERTMGNSRVGGCMGESQYIANDAL